MYIYIFFLLKPFMGNKAPSKQEKMNLVMHKNIHIQILCLDSSQTLGKIAPMFFYIN